MKRPIITQTSFLNIFSGIFKTTTTAFSIALTLIYSVTSLNAQIDCNSIMACNEGVQISLDDDCSMPIEPNMVLKSQEYSNSFYDVQAKMPNGTIITPVNVGTTANPVYRPTITAAHIGMTLEVKVSLIGCGNSCWSNAKIEDKLKPMVTACPCEPRITEFPGVINGSGPSYNLPIGSICTGGEGSFVLTDYTVFPFAVDATGIVDVSLGQTSLVFNIYQGSFDPANPCINRITPTTGRTFSGILAVGTNYFLVVSSQSDVDSGVTLPINNLSIDSRVGSVKSSVSGSICTIECNGEAAVLAQSINSVPNPPIFSDGCNGTNLTYVKVDSVETLLCAERFAKIIKRTWTATDASGNKSDEKVQYYYVKRGTLADVTCPADWIKDCSVSFAKLDNGAPTPAVSGQPTNLSCQNIQVYYNDIYFDLCGPGFKVYREWNIIDWCTGEDKICPQTIKVEDTVRPVITCPADITTQSGTIQPADIINTDANSCVASSWSVLPPISISECSKFTWEVSFKKADSSGNPPANAVFTKSDGTSSVIGAVPALMSTLDKNARPYRITNLPLGRTWLKYTVTDECGNSTDCFTEIDVVDKTPPTAICEGTTVISLDENGWGELFAETLDDHSNDNCSDIVKYEVRRKTTHCTGYATDLTFGPSVNFCCADISAPVSYVDVVLKVYDEAGNSNICETQVKVQNSRKPVIVCPADKTLSCGDAKIAAWGSATPVAFDTSFFGKPTVTGVCGNLQFNSRVTQNTINSCGNGTIKREWYVVSDPSVKCTQTLTVNKPTFTASNIIFPGDKTVNSCDVEDATPDILNSKPIITAASSCSQIGISFTDQLFNETSEACVKILRTWRVIDWCTYNAVTGPIFEKTQVILLKGTNAPVFSTPCVTQNLETNPARCDLDATFTVSATDECTEANDLRYTWSLDINKNNSIDFSGFGKTFNHTLDVGRHKVTFTVTNKCGTVATCMYDVVVTSKKKPTPICLGEVVWVMGADGTTEVWASDFNIKSEPSCGSTAGLIFAFDAAGTQKAKTFTCADLPNGQVARIPLKMYAIDAVTKESDFCEVILILQDSPLTNACMDNPGLLPTVAGRITTEAQEGIDEIEVGLTNMASNQEQKEMTSDEGAYMFTGVDVFDPKSIGAYKNTDVLNGVSTLDLVMIQRHILALQSLDSPYKLLAADVNNSRSITASDLVSLRKLILGITAEFENNTSWRFVPAEYAFEDPTFPFDFPSKINLDSIFEDKANVNFTAIKVGDVNGSAKANANSRPTENRTQSALIVADKQAYRTGQSVRYTLRSADAMDLIGAQFALNFDANALAFKGIEAAGMNIKSQHVNTANANNGSLVFSYDVAQGQIVDADAALITIVFEALSNGNTADISLDNNTIKAELYDTDANIRGIVLQSRIEGAKGMQNILYQNEPNPFHQNTNITFELAQVSNVTLRVLDINGRQVYVVQNGFDKGIHTVNINADNLAKSGVYYYQIEAGEFVATKKMILIE